MTQEELKQKREVILALMNDPMYRPMRLRDIAVFLDVPKARRGELETVLKGLVQEGRLRVSARGKYGKPERRTLVGTFLANARGFGFVRTEEEGEDIFIPRGETGGAMDGDTVRIAVEPGQRFCRAEGNVLEIMRRANTQIVGYYRRVKNFGLVLPDNQKLQADIRIPAGQSMGAATGHKVVAEITRFPREGDRQPEGKIIEILGHSGETGTDILSIIRSCGLTEEFPEEVLREAEKFPPDAFGQTQGRNAERRDLTGLLTLTIDGEDAKDLDDAISVEVLDSGNMRLGVHIADVSEYVREGSAVDREALRRGTSVYLPDRVIPMLPQALCNGICSLNAGEERLTLSCFMEVDEKGNIVSHELCESKIRSSYRMSYTAVSRIIEARDPALCERYAALVPPLEQMNEAACRLRRKRSERGYIDFDFPESRVILDQNGKTAEIRAYERNAATRLIEDFMLAANETVAEEFCWRQLPFLYRVHDRPDEEKMRELAVFIHNFGLTMKTRNGEIHPKEIQKLLRKAEGTETESLISRVALRAMKRACYSTECSGHFGLAAQYYTHFTSPIRRYPDLQIHRIIKEMLHGTLDAGRTGHYAAILPAVAAETSRSERRAEEAERESVRYKKCEYMEQHIGDIAEGVISGVTRFGIYIALPNTVEGMIRLQALKGDYYEYDERHWELVGMMTGRRYRLGERLRVRVAGADRLARTVDFIPAEQDDGIL